MPILTCVLHHHVGVETPFEAGIGVTTSRAAFEAQVDWLAERYDVISLDRLLSGDLPRRPLLLTFDDTFLSAFEAIRDVLAPRGLPSVYFANPGILGPEAIALDSALAWGAGQGGLAALCAAAGIPEQASLRDVVIGEMAKKGAAERAAIKARVLEAFPPDLSLRAPLMTEADLARLPEYGAEIGNHTMSHVHCRALSAEERASEIAGAKARLEEISGTKVRSFSVPYGHEADLTPEVLAAARDSGHEAIFLVHARSNLFRPARDVWYRTSLHEESPGEMAAHIRWKPVARSLRHRVTGR